MTKEVLFHTIQFFVLILLQVFVFNHMEIDGIVPFVYLLFILLYPVNYNKSLFLFISFLLGLSLDVFSSSGGIHAAACTLIAYIRPFILKFSFGTSYEFHTIKFSNTELGARITYFTVLIVIHHLTLFLLESFNFTFILFSLKQTLLSSIYTLLLSLMLLALFSKRKK